jgi:hypothetical protein
MMKKTLLTVLFLFLAALPAYAALQITTDHRPIFFGSMHIGEEKELAELGSYHNQVTCSSTNSGTWYLKVNALQPFSGGMDQIPVENFQWQLSWTNGNGTSPNSFRYKPFSFAPDLVYISGPNEASGANVNFQFRYSLKIPEAQTSGIYYTTIRFTLTEAF